MDRTTQFRKFKVAVERSTDEELREMRMQRAKAGNVADVADAVGFAIVSALSMRFREGFAKRPAVYSRKS